MRKKATPKAGITLFSKEEDGFKFVHSPTASGEVALKHKIGNGAAGLCASGQVPPHQLHMAALAFTT